jgi:hypothetical protein
MLFETEGPGCRMITSRRHAPLHSVQIKFVFSNQLEIHGERRLEPLVMVNAEKRRPVFAAYAKGGRRLHVGLQEFGEDVSAAVSAGAAKASSAIFGGLSSLKLGASYVANTVTIKRVDPREGQGPALAMHPGQTVGRLRSNTSDFHDRHSWSVISWSRLRGIAPEQCGPRELAETCVKILWLRESMPAQR